MPSTDKRGLRARTDKNLNSRTAKDSQELARTCQVLDQSLHVPLLALQVLGNPGDTLTRTGTRKTQNQFRAYKGRIDARFSCNNFYWEKEECFFSRLRYKNRESSLSSNNH